MIKKTHYQKALNECFKIHIERHKKYGDAMGRKEYQFMGLVKEKVDRLEHNFESGSKDYENKEDCLIDLINWSLFYLEKLIQERK